MLEQLGREERNVLAYIEYACVTRGRAGAYYNKKKSKTNIKYNKYHNTDMQESKYEQNKQEIGT